MEEPLYRKAIAKLTDVWELLEESGLTEGMDNARWFAVTYDLILYLQDSVYGEIFMV